ncbi:MAG: hypothetical protein LQ348_003636 [Seirophora lacunosa]|nr:MAG: hypothetical protein LQ348_003636 [Seirophora lacunosa]
MGAQLLLEGKLLEPGSAISTPSKADQASTSTLPWLFSYKSLRGVGSRTPIHHRGLGWARRVACNTITQTLAKIATDPSPIFDYLDPPSFLPPSPKSAPPGEVAAYQ